jgi:hypothetical protein
LANRFAAFKHKLAHAAGKIGTISHLAREPVRVDDESFFSRIAIAGKHFPEKLFTSSHNSQNRNPPDTQLGFGRSESTFVAGARPGEGKFARTRFERVHSDTAPTQTCNFVWSSAFRRPNAVAHPNRLKAELRTRAASKGASFERPRQRIGSTIASAWRLFETAMIFYRFI